MCFRGRILKQAPFPINQIQLGWISGNSDTYHVHDFKRYAAHRFIACVIGQVDALPLEIRAGLFAFESEGRATALDHERIDNPVNPGSLHM